VSVPSGVATNLEVSEIAATHARLTFTFDDLWLEKKGEMASVHGEFMGFMVGTSVITYYLTLKTILSNKLKHFFIYFE